MQRFGNNLFSQYRIFSGHYLIAKYFGCKSLFLALDYCNSILEIKAFKCQQSIHNGILKEKILSKEIACKMHFLKKRTFMQKSAKNRHKSIFALEASDFWRFGS